MSTEQNNENTLTVDGEIIPKYFGSVIPFNGSTINTSTRNKYYRDNNLTFEELDELIFNDIVCNNISQGSYGHNCINILICKVNSIKSMMLNDRDINDNYVKFQETSSHIKGDSDIKFLKITKNNKKNYFVSINYVIINHQNSFVGDNVDNTYQYSYNRRNTGHSKFPGSFLITYSNGDNYTQLKEKVFNKRNVNQIYEELGQIFDLKGSNSISSVMSTKASDCSNSIIDNIDKDDGKEPEPKPESEPIYNDPEIEICVKFSLLLYYNYDSHMRGGIYSSYEQPIRTQNYSFHQIYDYKGFFKEIYDYFDANPNDIESQVINLVNDDRHTLKSTLKISKYHRAYFTHYKWDDINYHDVMSVSNMIRSHINYDKCLVGSSLFYINNNIKSKDNNTRSKRYLAKNNEHIVDKKDINKYLTNFDIIRNNNNDTIKLAIRFSRYWINGNEKDYVSIDKYINLNVFNNIFEKGFVRYDDKNIDEYKSLIKLYSFIRTTKQINHGLNFNEMKILEDRGNNIEGEIMKYSYGLVNYKFLADSKLAIDDFVKDYVNIDDDEPNSLKNNIVLDKLFKPHNHEFDVDDKKFSKINMKLFGYQKQNVLWMEDTEDRILSGKFTFNFNVFHDHKYLEDKHVSDIDNNEPYIYIMNYKDVKYVVDTNYIDDEIVNNVYSKYYKKGKDGKYAITAKKYLIKLAADPQNPGTVAKLNKFTGIKVCKYDDYIKKVVKKIPLQGGFLCDEVGLGKTLSTITHIVNRIDIDKELYKKNKFEGNTLIILPPRLISQWVFEIEKYLVNKKELKVLKIMTVTDIKKMHKKITSAKEINKYDIFVISSNLLINEKYTAFLEGRELVTNVQKKATKTKSTKESKVDDKKKTTDIVTDSKKDVEKETEVKEKPKPKPKKKVDDDNYKFNIYKIKWNRIIIDEVHELLRGDIDISKAHDYNTYTTYYNTSKKLKKDLRELAELIRDGFTTNFKWCLTATPFEYGPINFANHIQYLIDKTQINACDKHYPILPLSMTSLTDANSLFNSIYKQTMKKDVREEIEIPLFSENIVWINQSNIERNIYNSYKSRMNINDSTDRKILFQICTNICITNEISEQLSELNVETLTLTELNKIMIKKFSGQIQKNNKSVRDKTSEIVQANILLEKFLYAFEYLKSNHNLSTFKTNIKNEIHRLFDNEQNIRQQTQFQELLAIIESSIVVMDENKEMIDLISTCKSGSYQFGYYLKFNTMSDIDKNYFMYKLFMRQKNYYNSYINDRKETIKKMEYSNERLDNQVKLFQSNDFIKEKVEDPCSICFGDFEDEVVITKCRHIFCGECFNIMAANKTSFPCPECRQEITSNNVNKTNMENINLELEAEPDKKTGVENVTKNPNDKEIILFSKNKDLKSECINKYGSKMAYLIEYLQALFEEKDNRVIIFSQYDRMLNLIGKTLDEYKIKNVFCKGQVHHVNKRIDMFKRDASYRVIMLSSEKANSGSNLTEANHIILTDVLNGEKSTVKDMEAQAIGRAVRLGQKKSVTVTRLITKNTIENEWHEKNKYDILEMQQGTPTTSINDSCVDADADLLKPKKKSTKA